LQRQPFQLQLGQAGAALGVGQGADGASVEVAAMVRRDVLAGLVAGDLLNQSRRSLAVGSSLELARLAGPD
jgi:hypothetical protein